MPIHQQAIILTQDVGAASCHRQRRGASFMAHSIYRRALWSTIARVIDSGGMDSGVWTHTHIYVVPFFILSTSNADVGM
jgi:hypothetical protein